ncbi:sensor histidine kinase [Kibdelosporangium aridum]|uniref:sensor histidine kinase n=1 Tax=Kibdelosporangium aridum TaxID=2030 RepID=UPI0035E8123E
MRSRWPADAGIALMVAVLFWGSGVWSTTLAILLGTAQIVPLLARRRAPVTVLVAVTAATVVHVLLGLTVNIGYVPVLIGIYSASSRLWLCSGAALAIASAMSTVKGPVNGGMLTLAISAVAWTLGVERQKHLSERAELEAAHRRERTAMRLHDTLGQTTTVMLVQAEALRSVGTLTEAERSRVDAILAAGREAMTEVRRTLADLRDDVVPDRETDLSELVERLRQAGLVLDDLPDIPEWAQRVVAEALTNVLRHAGPGTKATVTVNDVHVEVRNRIPGVIRPRGAGYGLSSLERHFGSRLVYGRRGLHWVVRVYFP